LIQFWLLAAPFKIHFRLLFGPLLAAGGAREAESGSLKRYITLFGPNFETSAMPGKKRPITQLWDFSPTVAGDLLQNSSVTPPDTQALNTLAPVDRSRSSQSDLPSYQKDGTSTLKTENKNIEQPIEVPLQGSYDEFMALDQAGLAMIGSDNNKEPSLVAIKRIMKGGESPVNRVTPFTSDHLVQIRNMYEDGDEIIIVYETMDVTLRQLTGILQGPLKAFQIAAICKEVSQPRSRYLEFAHHSGIAAGRSFIPAQGACPLSRGAQLRYNTSQPGRKSENR